jgi:hypothetical protein
MFQSNHATILHQNTCLDGGYHCSNVFDGLHDSFI